MALLSEKSRRTYFRKLGLGEYNTANIKKLQKKYLRAKDVDGIYGPDTDNLLRHLYNVLVWIPMVNDGKSNFRPEEFKCECGGRYCTGYPTFMKKVELGNLQRIRNHYGKPITVTCGMRCRPYNNSLRGSIPNSLHLTGYACDFYQPGVTDTLAHRKAAIRWIKTLPNHHYTYGDGINSYGYGVSASYMGNALHTDTSAPKKKAVDPLKPWYDAMTTQYNWSKNQKYNFVTPTVASSKSNGTCITFVAVALQRLGLLPSGKYFYLYPKTMRIAGNGASYALSHTELFTVWYPNKTVAQMGASLHKGDICGFGNPAYHTMVYMGKNASGQPLWNTMGHKRGLSVTYPYYANRKINMVVRLKKTSK